MRADILGNFGDINSAGLGDREVDERISEQRSREIIKAIRGKIRVAC